MTQQIKIINFGGVNSYLVKTDVGFILIDTGYPAKCKYLEKELHNAGCNPGNLKLVILTHGDTDHSGNAAYLQDKFSAKIALHHCDWGIVENEDMTWNRKDKPDKITIMNRVMSLASFFIKPGKFKRFKPDLTIDEDFDLSSYGFDAQVIHLPGHSKGSIGILTADGDLFCGDLLYNMGVGTPFVPFMDDMIDFNVSIEKLKKLSVKTVYPGHGKPFPFEKFLETTER